MAEIDPPSPEGLGDGNGPPVQLAGLARSWHRTQLAVLGFIGFCGILWSGDAAGVTGLQWLLMALVALAFVLEVRAIFLVGRVAYPVGDPALAAGADPQSDTATQARRLGTGIRLTYVALTLVVAATLSAWLPVSPDTGEVEVRDAIGRTWCGNLVEAPVGETGLVTEDGLVTVPLEQVAVLRPVGEC